MRTRSSSATARRSSTRSHAFSGRASRSSTWCASPMRAASKASTTASAGEAVRMLHEPAQRLDSVGPGMSSIPQPLAALFVARRGRGDNRSEERLRAHYLVERRLADRIRNARTPAERREIFATMYDELFRQVPDHPRLLAKGASSDDRERDI